MNIRGTSRSWPQAEGETPGLRGQPRRAPGRAEAPAEPFVLDLEPIEAFSLPARPGAALSRPGGASLPHRGRIIDIQI
ncbi:MAG: hypothetical protein AABZ64_00795 [Nitrospinota bacterium]